MVLSIALGFFLVLPKYHAYGDAKTAAVNNQTTLEDTKKQVELVSKLFDKVKSSADDLKRADLAVPPKPDVPEIYAYIETLTKSVNLVLNTVQATDESQAPDQNTASGSAGANPAAGAISLSPTNISATGGASLPGAIGQIAGGVARLSKNTSSFANNNLGAIDINLQVTGSYANFTSFLSKVQNSLRIMDVQNVSIAANQGKTDLTFVVSLKTYYRK